MNKKTLAITIAFAIALIICIALSITSLVIAQTTSSKLNDLSDKLDKIDEIVDGSLNEANTKLEIININTSLIQLRNNVDTLFAVSDSDIISDTFTKKINTFNKEASRIQTSINKLTPPNQDLAQDKADLESLLAETKLHYEAAVKSFANVTNKVASIKTVPNRLEMYVIPTFANVETISVNAQRLNADVIDEDITEAACFTMPMYGQYNLTLSAGDDTATVSSLNVVADEYNLVALNATLPVTMLTLDLWNINDVPTYVFFERVNSWDWTQLPENVYAFGDISQAAFHNNRTKMQAYIGELYKSNPDAHITLYTNDIYTENSLWMYQNNIPKTNFDIKLMSDGAASYNFFNTHLGNGNKFNQDVYNNMKAEWATAKARAQEGKSLAECVAGFQYVDHNSQFSTLRHYSYVVANEESNITWLLARPSLLAGYTEKPEDSTLPGQECIISVNMGTQLNNITANGLEDELKSLFNFDQDTFAAGNASGKKIMMLLGTSAEYDVYTEFLMFYCGDEYYIYYKGHPKMQTNDTLIDKYEAMGIDASINMSIPAELLIFFNPSISASGYKSSTFQNIESDIKVLFASKADIHNGASTPYRAEVYISIVAGTDNKIVKVEYEANDEVRYWSMDTDNYCANPNA